VKKVLFLLAVVSPIVMADDINKGRELAFDRSRGNCLACHMMEGGEMPGNVAPPLIAMKTRFPERSVLREQVWDATIRNPESVMPPYGRHGVLTEEEIDQVVDFVHSL
jgi:L-cysteine S-thiosulfotransferase